jgi:hypothetical protein
MRVDPDTCTDPDILAAEVRRLQAVIAARDTLTDAEREAIGYFAGEHCRAGDDQASHITTLRGLLERLK